MISVMCAFSVLSFILSWKAMVLLGIPVARHWRTCSCRGVSLGVAPFSLGAIRWPPWGVSSCLKAGYIIQPEDRRRIAYCIVARGGLLVREAMPPRILAIFRHGDSVRGR